MANQPLVVTTIICVAVAMSVAAVNLHSPIPDTSAVLDLSPRSFIDQTLTPWSNNQLGQPDPGSAVAYLPMALLFLALEAIKLPLVVVQGIWICALIAGSGIGMAWLYQLWSGRTSTAQLTASGLLYALSPYMWLNMKGATALLIPYALTPVIAGLAIRSIRGPTLRNVFGLIVVSCLSGIGINPPEAVIAAVIVAVLVLPELFRTRNAWWIIQWCLGIGALVVAGSVWWLGPFIVTIHTGGTAGYFTTDPLSIQAAFSSFREVMRLTGLWALYSGNNGVPYYPDAAFLNNPVVVAVTLLVPALFAASVSRVRSDDRWRVAALCLLVIVAVPMAVSIYPPADPSFTGRVYSWLYSHVYAFRAFRSNYKWVAALACAYALVVPLCMERTVSIMASWRFRVASGLRDVATVGITLVIITYSVPALGGLLFPAAYRMAALPRYWTEAGHWLTAQPESGRVLFLPFEGFPNYTWGDPSGDIASVVTTRPSLMSQPGIQLPGGATKLLHLLAEAGTGRDVPLAHLAAMLGVRYIVDQQDIAWRAIGSPSPVAMIAYLSTQPGIRLVRTFGKLSIYEVTGAITPLLGSSKAELEVASDQGISGVVAASPGDTLVRPGAVQVVNGLVSQFSASSVWSNLKNEYGPQNVLNGTAGGSAWVSGVPGGIGQWINLKFRYPIAVPQVTIVGRQDGIDAVPTVVKVMAGLRQWTLTLSNGVGTIITGGALVGNIKVVIEETGPGGPNVGISAVDIPGVPLNTLQYPMVGRRNPFIATMNPGAPGIGNLMHVIPARHAVTATVTGSVSADPTESNGMLMKYLQPSGVSTVSSSSEWNGLAEYSGLWTLANDPAMAWVPANAGGANAWVQYTFPNKRFIGNIGIQPRDDGIDGIVDTVEISMNGRSLGLRSLALGTVTNVPVDATGSILRITIVSATKGQGGNVGIAKVVIPGVSVKRNNKLLSLVASISNNGTKIPLDKAGVSTYNVDKIVTGEEAVQFNAIKMELSNGKNSIGWNGRGIWAMGNLTISAGNVDHAILHPVAIRERSSVEITSGEVRPGLLSLCANTDGEWFVKVGKRARPGENIAGGFGPVWTVRNRYVSVGIIDHGGVIVTEWLELQAAIMIVAMLIAAVWCVRRRRVWLRASREE